MEKSEQAPRKLYRSRSDRMFAGVCGGLGKYFEIDTLIFRILFLLFIFGGGFGILLYIILALVIPNEPIGMADPANSHNPGDFKEKVENLGQRVRENANDLAREVRDGRTFTSMRNILGIFIAALGAFLLIGNLFPRLVRWDLFWPMAIIVVGLLIVFRRK